MKRVAVLSVHSCPLAALGGKETGGMNVYVREISRQMGRLGIGVDVFTRSQNPHISPIVFLGQNARVVHIKAGPEEPVAKHKLLQYMPAFTSEVVRFARNSGTSYDLIHSHYWLSGWVGGRLKKLWSVPLVHMFHTLGVLKNTAGKGGKEMEPPNRLRVEKEIGEYADCIVAPSPWEKKQMVLLNGIPASRVKVIPCGVDLQLFRPIPSSRAMKFLGITRRNFILYVGRIDAIKGIDVLIRAVHRLTCRPEGEKGDLGLIVVGGELDEDAPRESREMQSLRVLVQELKLQDRVAFWGSQRQDLLPYFYSATQALVLPSRYESFGMVALEAMACGTPVIASRVGGLKYTIENGRTGLLVPEDNPALLADGICRVVECPGVRKKLVRAALAKVRRFGWPEIAREVLSAYRALTGGLGQRKPKGPGSRERWLPVDKQGFRPFPSGGFSSSPGELGCCWQAPVSRPRPAAGPGNP
ncbi:MAG: glycosyltransferase [Syntrophaceae bacterium]|nr:glycosyltransferase [Syntrophaceae bacterium]